MNVCESNVQSAYLLAKKRYTGIARLSHGVLWRFSWLEILEGIPH